MSYLVVAYIAAAVLYIGYWLYLRQQGRKLEGNRDGGTD